MKGHPLLLFFIILLAMVPIYYINRGLHKVIQPRETAGRFFLFIFANFLLIVVYTMTVVAVVVRLFPAQ